MTTPASPPPVDDAAGTPAAASRRTLLIAGCGVLGALLVAMLVLLVVRAGNDGDVPGRTSVAGVDLGGLSRSEALDKLRDSTRDRLDDPIAVTVGDRQDSVKPAAAGLSLDVEASVDAALKSGRHLGSKTVPPVVRVDDSKMKDAVGDLAGAFDHKGVVGGVSFKGAQPQAVAPVTGVTLDQSATAEAMRDAYLVSTEPVQLPADLVESPVDAEEVERALTDIARPAVAAPLTIADGDRSTAVTPVQLAKYLSFAPGDSGRLDLKVDGQGLADEVDEKLGTLELRPRDATFQIVDGRPQVVPARNGKRIDPAALERSVADVVTRTADRSVQVLRMDADAGLTTEQAQQLGVVEKLSGYTQNFPVAAYRTQNIGTAARKVNGTLLKPGDIFSMNRTIGERTEKNGYTEGIIIDHGRYQRELGGGVSTATTTVWDAAFFAGLERIEQRAHSLYISRYKAGLEATVSFGSLDLRFRNDSPHGVFITATATNHSITVTMYGTKRYDVTAEPNPVPGRSAEQVPGRYNVTQPRTIYDQAASCEPQAGEQGFSVDVNRVFRPVGGGAVIKSEKLTTRYQPTNKVVCGPDPAEDPGADDKGKGKAGGSLSPTPTPTTED